MDHRPRVRGSAAVAHPNTGNTAQLSANQKRASPSFPAGPAGPAGPALPSAPGLPSAPALPAAPAPTHAATVPPDTAERGCHVTIQPRAFPASPCCCARAPSPLCMRLCVRACMIVCHGSPTSSARQCRSRSPTQHSTTQRESKASVTVFARRAGGSGRACFAVHAGLAVRPCLARSTCADPRPYCAARHRRGSYHVTIQPRAFPASDRKSVV